MAFWQVIIISALFMVACKKSNPAKEPESIGHTLPISEPDYSKIIGDLRIEAALQAMRSEDGSFKEVDSAGAPDTLEWFRHNLETLDLSLFQEVSDIEGILFVGGKIRSGSGSAQVQTLSIIEGRSGLMTDTDDISVSPTKLIDALRSRSE